MKFTYVHLLTTLHRLCSAFLACVVLLSITMLQSASAAELVMFEAKGCTVCKKFNESAGKEYPTSSAAKVLPLRRLDLHDDEADFVLKLPVRMTPTFVFVSDGVEITRFVGYPGRKYFFQIVDAAAEELGQRDGDTKSKK